MILKECNVLHFEDNDIYRSEIYGDKIIVNEDYYGIRILDFSLNTIKIIPIIEGLKISYIYKQSDGSAIIVYDSYDPRLIFIDLETCNPIIINLDNFIDHYFWPYTYYWEKNSLIFALDRKSVWDIEQKNVFYQFNFKSFALERISSKQVRLIAPCFIDFYKTCKKYRALTIDCNKKTFVFKKNRNLLGFHDYENKNTILTKHRLGFFEEEVYYNDNFVFFCSWKKNIVFKKYKVFIRSEDPYYCLRLNFLSKDTILLLETNRNDHKLCRIGTYKLETSSAEQPRI